MSWLRDKLSILGYAALIAVVIFIAGYYTFIDGLMVTLERSQRMEAELKHDFEYKQRKLANKKELKLQMKEIRHVAGDILWSLPYKIDVDVEKNEITDLAGIFGVEVENMEFRRERLHEFFAGLPFRLQATGDFEGLYNYINYVFNTSGIASKLTDFTLQRNDTDAKLRLDINGYLHRVILDE